ncbi:hypothetical protein RIF29_10842 [Crotalaria pallida]|uniref:Uncharacterized protein n=1 Tax=Crotalaria pallida TaxID=3830 RepID=A0AAN9FTA5_CROPI
MKEAEADGHRHGGSLPHGGAVDGSMKLLTARGSRGRLRSEGCIEMMKANLPSTPTMMDHTHTHCIGNQRGQKNKESKQPHLHQDQRRSCNKDRVIAKSKHECFLENNRPVAKSHGHDIIKENAFASKKNPAEENDTENDDDKEHDDDDVDEEEDDNDDSVYDTENYDDKEHDDDDEEEEEEEDDNDDSVLMDPQYQFFLSNLRPDGNFYALDIVEDNVFVKYHQEPSSPEALTAFPNENENHVTNAVATVVNKEKHTPAKYEGKRRGRKPKHPKLNADKSASGSCSHVFAIDDSNHVSNANALVAAAMPAPVKYEGKRRGRKPKYPKLYVDKSANSNCSHVASEAHKLPGRGTVVLALPDDKGKRRGRKLKGISKLLAFKNTKGNSNHVSSEVHDRAGKRRGKRGKKNAVPLALESACFGPTEGQTIDHEIKEENKDDDYDDDAHHRRRPVHNPVLNANLFLEEDDEANAKKPTEFRKNLIEELKKPYCQEEYKRLFKEITKRKPTQGQKVLRGRTKIYDKKHIAKSYLHHHVDLARKIDKVRHDHHKVLILLRGFFYWLKGSSGHGEFTHDWMCCHNNRKESLPLIFSIDVLRSGIAFPIQIGCIDRGGPVFVAMYQHVQTFVFAILICCRGRVLLGRFSMFRAVGHLFDKMSSALYSMIQLGIFRGADSFQRERTATVTGLQVHRRRGFLPLWLPPRPISIARSLLCLVLSSPQRCSVLSSTHQCAASSVL